MTTRVGAIVAEARKQRGWTLRETAKRLGCSHAHLGEVERGKKLPSARMMHAFVMVLDLRDSLALAWSPDQIDRAKERIERRMAR